jgi:glycerol-3-phosphate O-acyltransferase
MVKYAVRLSELNILKSEKRTHKDLKIVFLHTLLNELFKLIDKENGKINYATHLKGKSDGAIQRGLDNVGVFHLNRPLIKNKKGNIITKDLSLLYYYHNRLVGYDLEQFI